VAASFSDGDDWRRWRRKFRWCGRCRILLVRRARADGFVQGKVCQQQHLELATQFFDAWADGGARRKHMMSVTGLSASGPAYIYIILESLARLE